MNEHGVSRVSSLKLALARYQFLDVLDVCYKNIDGL